MSVNATARRVGIPPSWALSLVDDSCWIALRPSLLSSDGRCSTERSSHRSATSMGPAVDMGSDVGSSSHSRRTRPSSVISDRSSGSFCSMAAMRWASVPFSPLSAWRPARLALSRDGTVKPYRGATRLADGARGSFGH